MLGILEDRRVEHPTMEVRTVVGMILGGEIIEKMFLKKDVMIRTLLHGQELGVLENVQTEIYNQITVKHRLTTIGERVVLRPATVQVVVHLQIVRHFQAVILDIRS